MHTMEISMENGRASAQFREFCLETGTNLPSPLDLFIASLGTCAALTAAGYCRKKGLSSEGLKINIDIERDTETRLVSQVRTEFVIPAGFPKAEIEELVAVAGHCFVKKHLYAPPEFTTIITQG